jgi:hypothetical protein
VLFMDSGSSLHMTIMSSTFLSVSKMGSEFHVKSGVCTMHAVKGVGCVRFQLNLGGSLEVAQVIYVPGLKFLSISALEEMGNVVMFEGGKVCIRSEGEDTQDETMRLNIREGLLYRLLGQPVVGSNGFLDSYSLSVSGKVARERELIPRTQSSFGTLKEINIHEWTQMDVQESVQSLRIIYSVHGSTKV